MYVTLLCVSCDEKMAQPSRIDMDSETVTVPAAGGRFAVAYRLSSSVGDKSIEAVCPYGWVNSFDYSTDGIVSFNVEPNDGEKDRETRITVIHSDTSVVFRIFQHNPGKVLPEELENARWTATRCDFERTGTKFHALNPDIPSEFLSDPLTGIYKVITAESFAGIYARDWNNDHPDDMMLPEEALVFDFTDETYGIRNFYDVAFYKGEMAVSNGQVTASGATEVVRIEGDYTLDEETGLITVEDKSNSTYTRTVTIKIEKDGRYIRFKVLKTWWPDYLAEHYGDEDRFGFNISNYNATELYSPSGNLTYTLEYYGEVYPQ